MVFIVHFFTNADVAQLARASPCHGEGRGFDSRHPLQNSQCEFCPELVEGH